MQKLLIAIRSEIICAALAEALRDLDVHICHSGKTALALIDSLRPNILIIDLSLPIIDGLTVLRSANHKPSIIIALTSVTTDRVLADALQVGVRDLIPIPCTIDHITGRLRLRLQESPSPGL